MDNIKTMRLDPVRALNFHLTVEEAMDCSDDFVCEDDTLIMKVIKGTTARDSYCEVTANEALLVDLRFYNKFSTLYSLECIQYN